MTISYRLIIGAPPQNDEKAEKFRQKESTKAVVLDKQQLLCWFDLLLIALPVVE